jgi:hypothetical protein
MADVVQVVAVVLVHLVLMMSTNIFLKIRGKWWKNRRNWWRRYVGWLSSCNVYKQYIYSRFNFHLGIFAAQENIFKSLQSPLDNLMHDSLQTRLEKTTWELLSFLSVVMLYLMHITHHFPCMVLLNICFWVDWYIGVLGHFQLFFLAILWLLGKSWQIKQTDQ